MDIALHRTGNKIVTGYEGLKVASYSKKSTKVELVKMTRKFLRKALI